MFKGINNAFNVFCLIKRGIISVKIGLSFQEITFRTEFLGSKNILTGGKWDFQVANLLLATVNFEPCLITYMLFNICCLP